MTVNNGSPTTIINKQVPPFRRGQQQQQPPIRKRSNTDKPNINSVVAFRRPLSSGDSSLQNVVQVDEDHQEFTILKTLSSGEFTKIYLARPELGACKRSLEQALVLKAFKRENTTEEEFYSELDTNYWLSPHPNVVTSFNVSFHWDEFRLFPLEHAPFGDLSRFIRKEAPMPEGHVKAVASQLSGALDFMHSLKLVHRNIVPENVLVFAKDCSLVKLSDFGATVAARTLLTKTSTGGGDTTTTTADEVATTGNTGNMDETGTKNNNKNNRSRSNSVTGGSGVGGGAGIKYLPPEICGLLPQEKYHCYSSIDVWQMGILLFACITGGGCPWKMADAIRDPGFNHYCDWLKKRCCMKTPLAFQNFSPRFTRLLKRILEPKPTKRCPVLEVSKYLKDDWLLDRGDSSKSNFLLTGSALLSKSTSFSGLLQLVSRSNSEVVGPASVGTPRKNKEEPALSPLGRAGTTTCKKSNSMGTVRRRKSGVQSGDVVSGRGGRRSGMATPAGEQRKEPVFRICCKFQCKNQPINATTMA